MASKGYSPLRSMKCNVNQLNGTKRFLFISLCSNVQHVLVLILTETINIKFAREERGGVGENVSRSSTFLFGLLMWFNVKG